MSFEYLDNTFEKGLVTDVSPQQQSENSVRQAVNMDFALLGDMISYTPLNGTQNIYSIASTTGYQVIGAFPCNGKVGGVMQQGFILFIAGVSTTDLIVFHSVQSEYYSVLFSGNLNLPVDGTVDGFAFTELTTPKFYFTDNVNNLRVVVVDDAYTNTLVTMDIFPSIVSGTIPNNIAFVALSQGGNLTSGTYQFAVRFYNRNNFKYSTWGLFTPPIPAIADTSAPLLGGGVGVNTGKKIDLSIDGGAGISAGYDTFQLAVIKNNTGDMATQTVCYLLPMQEIVSSPQPYSYTGNDAETELPLSEIVVEPANIKSAKTWTQKDLRALPGNIEYNDRRIQDTECTFDTAYTKKFPTSMTNYSDGEVFERYGHFRDELYRYGIVCRDARGLWGQVKPLDLGVNSVGRSLRRLATVDPVTGAALPSNVIATSGYLAARETVQVSITGNFFSSYPIGTLVKITNGGTDYVYYVSDRAFITGLTLLELGHANVVPPSFVGNTIQVCLGDAYNHSSNTDWRYPSRDKPFAALLDGSNVQNMGLRIEGIKDFPTWATAFAIVRRPRIKNILGQTPHIPLVASQGVVTPGKNVTNNDDYNEVNDTIMPKVFRIGGAANLGKYTRQLLDAGGGSSFQDIEQIAWLRQDASLETGLVASPRGALLAHPDFVFNNAGEPFGGFDIGANAILKPVDAVWFDWVGASFNIVDGSNFSKEVYIYNALTANNYYYRGDGLQYQKYSGGVWNDVPYAKLLNTQPMTLAGIQSAYTILNTLPVVNGSALQTLPFSIFPLSTNYQNIVRYGGQTDLSQQQVDSGINQIPAAERIRFGNEVQVQRALLAHLNIALPDPSAIIATQETALLTKLFKTALPATNNMFGTSFLNVLLTSRWGTSAFNTTPIPVNVSDVALSTETAAYAMILNIEAGLGEDRYGDIEAQQTWQLASDVVELDGSLFYNVDILGGDCFIGQYAYKVNNGINRPVVYQTVQPSTGLDFATGLVAKTGSQLDMVEVLTLFMESEIDSRYFAENDRFPYQSGSIVNFDRTWFYSYNGGFSASQNQKIFANPDLRNPVNNRFPSRFLISDQKVYQTGIEGFNIYRVNSFFDLDEQFGELTRLVKRVDDALLAVQEFAIRVIPVNENIITETGGEALSVATNVYIPDKVVRYITTQYGSQHIRGVISTEMGVCLVDARNRALVMLSDGVDLLSSQGNQNIFDNVLDTNNKIPENRLQLWYDSRLKELHFYAGAWQDSTYVAGNATGTVNRSGMWLVYNTRFKAFKTQFGYADTDQTLRLWLVSAGGTFYQIRSGDSVLTQVGQMYEGAKGLYVLGDNTIRGSVFECVFVGEPYTAKVFDVMLINSNKPLTSIDFVAEFDGVTLGVNGVSAEVTPRNGLFYVNEMRNAGDMARLRGKYLRAIFRIDNNPSEDIVVNGISVKYRKSQRVR